ncbi:hypothetical protein GQ472_03520 [archaeon]|nr:hypothetical protein [archaeon]
MGELYTHRLYAAEMKELDISIVDALTGSACFIELLVKIDMGSIDYDLECCDYLGEERIRSGRVKSEPLAINYAERKSDYPPTLLDVKRRKLYEIYSIDGDDTKIIAVFENSDLTGFYDTVKLFHDKHYIWDGTVDEIIEEFKKAEFEFKEKSPLMR